MLYFYKPNQLVVTNPAGTRDDWLTNGQFEVIKAKLSIRIGDAKTAQIIKDLTALGKAGVSKANMDLLFQKILNDAAFREKFIRDYKAAVQGLEMYSGETGGLAPS